VKSPQAQPEFAFEYVTMARPDGTYLVKPTKLVVKQEDISVEEAAQILRCTPSHIYYLIKVEGALTYKQRKPKARYALSRAQVQALADKGNRA
jgi:hypothetical protein